jgi:hypothetical protein
MEDEPMTHAADTGLGDDIVDYGEDRICESMDEPGFHVFDLDDLEWETPAKREMANADLAPPSVVKEKWLVRPDESKDRMPISIIKFPPNYKFPRHWHQHGEFVMILKGSAFFAGRELKVGDMAYNDSRTVYGSEEAGPDGVEFLMIRRAFSTTTIVRD